MNKINNNRHISNVKNYLVVLVSLGLILFIANQRNVEFEEFLTQEETTELEFPRETLENLTVKPVENPENPSQNDAKTGFPPGIKTNQSPEKFWSTHFPANLIGIGSKKCGTGAFRDYLQKHPKTKLHQTVEGNFFTQGRYSNLEENPETLLVKYLQKFKSPNHHDDIIYEMTPRYMAENFTALRIKNYYDFYNSKVTQTSGQHDHESLNFGWIQKPVHPKFVAVVCNPIKRAFSDYHQVLSTTLKGKSIFKKNLLKYQNFDDFVQRVIPGLEINNAKNNPDFLLSLRHNSKIYEYSIITSSLFYYQIENWLKYFPNLQDIIFINGDNLIAKPWEEMSRAMARLNLTNQYYTQDMFEKNESTGFYCYKGHCLTKTTAKGRTRSKNSTLSISPESYQILKNFYQESIDLFENKYHFKLPL